MIEHPTATHSTMPSALKAAKAPSKKSSPQKAPKDKGKSKATSAIVSAKTKPTHPPTEDLNAGEVDELAEGSDEDDEGVDEEGMTRLMQALGEDGLDEFDTAQLQALDEDEEGSGDEDWETDNEEGGEDSDSGSEEGEDAEDEVPEDLEGPEASDEEDEEEEEDIALDDIDGSVDEDAVPRQKIEIDNKVRRIPLNVIYAPAYDSRCP